MTPIKLQPRASAGPQTASPGSQGSGRLAWEEELQERGWEQGAPADLGCPGTTDKLTAQTGPQPRAKEHEKDSAQGLEGQFRNKFRGCPEIKKILGRECHPCWRSSWRSREHSPGGRGGGGVGEDSPTWRKVLGSGVAP